MYSFTHQNNLSKVFTELIESTLKIKDDTLIVKFCDWLSQLISRSENPKLFIHEAGFLEYFRKIMENNDLPCDRVVLAMRVTSSAILVYELCQNSQDPCHLCFNCLVENEKSYIANFWQLIMSENYWLKPSIRYASLYAIYEMIQTKDLCIIHWILKTDMLSKIMNCVNDSSMFIARIGAKIFAKILYTSYENLDKVPALLHLKLHLKDLLLEYLNDDRIDSQNFSKRYHSSLEIYHALIDLTLRNSSDDSVKNQEAICGDGMKMKIFSKFVASFWDDIFFKESFDIILNKIENSSIVNSSTLFLKIMDELIKYGLIENKHIEKVEKLMISLMVHGNIMECMKVALWILSIEDCKKDVAFKFIRFPILYLIHPHETDHDHTKAVEEVHKRFNKALTFCLQNYQSLNFEMTVLLEDLCELLKLNDISINETNSDIYERKKLWSNHCKTFRINQMIMNTLTVILKKLMDSHIDQLQFYVSHVKFVYDYCIDSLMAPQTSSIIIQDTFHTASQCIKIFSSNKSATSITHLEKIDFERFVETINRNICSSSWEVRDTCVNVIELLVEISKDNGIYKSWLIDKRLCKELLFTINDGEGYVRASTLKCLQTASCISEIWLSFIDDDKEADLFTKVSSICHIDCEMLCRKSALDVITCWYFNNVMKNKTEELYLLINNCINDEDYEVQIAVLQFWENFIKQNYPLVFSVKDLSDDDYDKDSFKTFFLNLLRNGCLSSLTIAAVDFEKLVRIKAFDLIYILLEIWTLMEFTNKSLDVNEDESKRLHMFYDLKNNPEFQSSINKSSHMSNFENSSLMNSESLLEDILFSLSPISNDTIIDCY